MYDNVFFSLHVLDEFKEKKMKQYGKKRFNHFFYNFPKQSIIIEKIPPLNCFENVLANDEKKKLIDGLWERKITQSFDDHLLVVSGKAFKKLMSDINEFFRVNKRRRNVVITFKKAEKKEQ